LDLAKSVISLYSKNPEKHEIIETGIREGEKLHENLITKEEVTRFKEFNGMYVLPPPNSKEYENFPMLKSSYSSDQGELMQIDEIKQILNKILSDNDF